MLSPEEALSELKRGNERFVKDSPIFPHVNARRRRETTINGQKPFATILTCSDSRTPPEYIFDRGIGDLFVIRVAGNICGGAALGSIELGVEHIGSRLVIVLGHRNCGVITMAVENSPVGAPVEEITARIRAAEKSALAKNPGLSRGELIEATTKENAFNSIADMLKGSRIVREKVRAEEIALLAAYYDIESGEVEWLGAGDFDF